MSRLIEQRIAEIQHAATMGGALSLWTIYDHPKDQPDHFVARRFEARHGHPEPIATQDIIRGRELEPLREYFRKAGLVCLARYKGDDAKIVEMWL